MFKINKDSFFSGLIPGLILPWIGFYIYYLLFFNYMSLEGFASHLRSIDMLVSVVSLGAILNLAMFFIFYQFKLDRSAKGVIGATFVYAFIVIIYKSL
jgi:hypothetical protein